MTTIQLNFNNLFDSEVLLSLFPSSNIYELTAKNVFRLKKRVISKAGHEMVHNGYDYARKKGFGKVKIGKQICQVTGEQYHEDKSFWKKLLSDWKETITSLIMMLRNQDVSWEGVSNVMDFIIPFGKTKGMYLFNEKITQFEYEQDAVIIVNYDEQHPKAGRSQKFRLTLLNHKTKVPIADELFNSKDAETIEAFLRKYLDADKKIVLITDCDRAYPKIFKKIWGKNIIHQKCLLHLNKLISKDFGKNITIQNLYNKYLFLDIFYNRKKELKFIEKLLNKQQKKVFSDYKEKRDWVTENRREFYDYVRKLEKKRRREGKNLPQRPLWKAKKNFEKLRREKELFPKKAQDRLKMIENNWEYFTAFYSVKDCPATNNAIENYYSTSLKTHRKKQLRTDEGLENHMKLSALKRVQGFKPKKTLLEIYGLFKLITS
jgi:hypothetical protein